MRRTEILQTDQIYHIFNKSIAGYVIFNNPDECSHFLKTLQYYQDIRNTTSLSHFLRLKTSPKPNRAEFPSDSRENNQIEMIAYCLMPTHFHIVLKQTIDNGISRYLGNIENSYTRYFNTKNKRKGPLWEGRFKNVLVETDEQLLHLTRYVHLNPVTASLVQNPSDWTFSSYSEYIKTPSTASNKICQKDDILDISPLDYKEFVLDQVSYQKELHLIKHLIIE